MSSENADAPQRVAELERALAERDATIARLEAVRASLIARALRASGQGAKGGYGLLESQALLSQQVRGRTHELQVLTEKLLAAKEQAEAAMRARTTFLAAMSHEIRTPLNGIIGYTELIQEADDPEKMRAHASIVLRESELLLTLINDILDYAKIDAGRLDLESVPLDPRRIIDSVFDVQRRKATAKGLGLEAVVDANVPDRIAGDPVRLRQILLNLVDNAVKFTPQGSVKVRLCASDPSHPGHLRFEVEDTGIGIPADKQSLIFDPFTQADDGTTRRYGGTGLGTSIARHLVCLMGGKIGVRSQPGEGSVFWFTVPLRAVASLDPSIRPSEGCPGASRGLQDCLQTTPPGTGRRVLVVDDHPTNLDLISLQLRAAGYEVECAAGGHAALAACEASRFDLIFMDVQMPEMDGYEAARRIRRAADWRLTVPIVALTADAREECAQACHAAGMNGVMHKPIRRPGLLDAVGRMLCLQDHGALAPGTKVPLGAAVANVVPSLVVLEGGARSAMDDSGEEPIDLAVAIEEFGGPEEFDRIVTEFLTHLDGQLAALDDALDCGDVEAVRREAHSIKGGAGMLEAAPLMEAARRLEAAAKSRESDALADLVHGVRRETVRLKDCLNRRAPAMGSTHAQPGH